MFPIVVIIGGIIILVLIILLNELRRYRSYTYPEPYFFANTIIITQNQSRVLDYLMEVSFFLIFVLIIIFI